MNDLETFLDLNGIERDEIDSALHLDIREIILKAVIEKMKADSDFFLVAKKYYFKYENLDAAHKIIQAMCDISLSDDDLKWFDRCFRAFMKKKNSRATISEETKEILLKKQNFECAQCGVPITLSTMHADHIIPWDYVGDELDDNLQGLCSDCNLHKSNHVAVAVSNIILNRRKQL